MSKKNKHHPEAEQRMDEPDQKSAEAAGLPTTAAAETVATAAPVLDGSGKPRKPSAFSNSPAPPNPLEEVLRCVLAVRAPHRRPDRRQHRLVLPGQHRPGVEQHAPSLDARHHRGVAGAQPRRRAVGVAGGEREREGGEGVPGSVPPPTADRASITSTPGMASASRQAEARARSSSGAQAMARHTGISRSASPRSWWASVAASPASVTFSTRSARSSRWRRRPRWPRAARPAPRTAGRRAACHRRSRPRPARRRPARRPWAPRPGRTVRSGRGSPSRGRRPPRHRPAVPGRHDDHGRRAGQCHRPPVHGYVVDFIQVHWGGWYFPSFNLADSAITLGAALLIVDEIRRVRRGR